MGVAHHARRPDGRVLCIPPAASSYGLSLWRRSGHNGNKRAHLLLQIKIGILKRKPYGSPEFQPKAEEPSGSHRMAAMNRSSGSPKCAVSGADLRWRGARADEDGSQSVMSANKPPSVGGLKTRILFVDDEAILREHLAQVLSDDYRVDTAGNGTEALRAVLRAKPDLIVTDIVMPDMDGLELLRILRETPSTQGIPVLLISGQAADEQRIEGLERGADGYLAKPYTERELRALIGSMLHAAQLRADVAGRAAREQAEQRALIERASLLESITDAFYALDAQWRFTYVNQRAIDFYGKEREDLLGQGFWDVFPELIGSVFQQHHERALRERCSVSFETLLPLSARWVDVRAYPTPQGLAVNFSDITQRKHTEQELERALAQLRGREEQLRENEHQLTSEVDAMRRLYALVNRLLGCNDLQTALEEVLEAAGHLAPECRHGQYSTLRSPDPAVAGSSGR